MTEDVTKVINDRQDSIKITRGQRGSVGFELKVYGNLLDPKDNEKLLKEIKRLKAVLEKELRITDEIK